MIDLHMHSTFSDGTFTPEELVAEAQKGGLSAMALTDHDTIGGVPRLLAAAQQAGIRAITGVEVSADFPSGTMHMLGYCVRHDDAELIEHLRWIREGRDERNKEILAKLNALGLTLTMEEVLKFVGEDVVGRPHFAQALIQRGYVKDKREAFDKYLARGRPAYAERKRLTPSDTIQIIRRAGGVPVLAHPFALKRTVSQLRELLREFCDLGLLGIEVYYPDHNPDMQREFLKLAKEFNLVATGGSDFHGANSPNTVMGRGYGSLNVPDDVVDHIEAASRR